MTRRGKGTRPDLKEALDAAGDMSRPAAREAQRRARLPVDAACATCGVRDPAVLEAHHTSGRHHDAATVVVLCLNHHKLQSAAQSDNRVPMSPQPSILEQLAAALLAQAVWHGAQAEAAREWAARLVNLIGILDASHPSWRKLR